MPLAPTRGRTTMFWAAFGYSKRTNIVTMKGDPDAPRGSVITPLYTRLI
jgi:hypothetical protein